MLTEVSQLPSINKYTDTDNYLDKDTAAEDGNNKVGYARTRPRALHFIIASSIIKTLLMLFMFTFFFHLREQKSLIKNFDLNFKQGEKGEGIGSEHVAKSLR